MKMRELICPTLCRYHKPEKIEEPGCGGLNWLRERPHLQDHLTRLDPRDARPLFGLAPEDPRLWAVCQSCPFLPDGCDFRDPAHQGDAGSPCGGLRAIAGLLAAGVAVGI